MANRHIAFSSRQPTAERHSIDVVSAIVGREKEVSPIRRRRGRATGRRWRADAEKARRPVQ